FVTDIINIYYGSEEAVCEDLELKAFVKDIFVYGMRGNKDSGFPKTIKTREKLSEYLTIVIFTSSAQHAAVNFGQMVEEAEPPAAWGEAVMAETLLQTGEKLWWIVALEVSRTKFPHLS
ncbi:hypothetical protein L345_15007, partial [Ophiophagus hannah]